jgi:predicted hydrocarbon binding protein
VRGLIFTSLKEFVTDGYGEPAWSQLLANTGLTGRSYLATDTYPDEEVLSLVTAASSLTNLPADILLRDFGRALVPGLVKTYRAFIKPQWRSLDLIAAVESQIHKAVRLREPDASPPRLRATRTSPTEVVVRYDSPRRLCALAEGIVTGLAVFYGERVQLRHTTCMHRGDTECTLVVNAEG